MRSLNSVLFSAILMSCLASCESDKKETPVYSILVSVNDNQRGNAYIETPGTTLYQAEAGKDVTLYAIANSGYEFVGWQWAGGSGTIVINENPYTINKISCNYRITANFDMQSETPDPDPTPEPEPDEKTLIFEDNFDNADGIPDPAVWMFGPRNNVNWSRYNSQSYDQAYVKDGKLVLVAEMIDGEYKTGAIRMIDELAVEYCTVEVCARFTKMVQGGWPAIWMMPSQPIYPSWPGCGEIDIMEHLNKDNYYYTALHSYYIDTLGKKSPSSSTTIRVNTSEFNIYTLTWNDSGLTFYLNGEQTFSYPNMHLDNEGEMKQWPFATKFYLILNQALGGPGTWPGPINDEELPAIFEVDWVKIYK